VVGNSDGDYTSQNREARPLRAALATQILSDPPAQNGGDYFVPETPPYRTSGEVRRKVTTDSEGITTSRLPV
jgi:hypothetical protein